MCSTHYTYVYNMYKKSVQKRRELNLRCDYLGQNKQTVYINICIYSLV